MEAGRDPHPTAAAHRSGAVPPGLPTEEAHRREEEAHHPTSAARPCPAGRCRSQDRSGSLADSPCRNEDSSRSRRYPYAFIHASPAQFCTVTSSVDAQRAEGQTSHGRRGDVQTNEGRTCAHRALWANLPGPRCRHRPTTAPFSSRSRSRRARRPPRQPLASQPIHRPRRSSPRPRRPRPPPPLPIRSPRRGPMKHRRPPWPRPPRHPRDVCFADAARTSG